MFEYEHVQAATASVQGSKADSITMTADRAEHAHLRRAFSPFLSAGNIELARDQHAEEVRAVCDRLAHEAETSGGGSVSVEMKQELPRMFDNVIRKVCKSRSDTTACVPEECHCCPCCMCLSHSILAPVTRLFKCHLRLA